MPTKKRKISSFLHPEAPQRVVKKTNRIDVGFLSVVIILLVLGLIMVFSASYPSANARYGDGLYFIRRQAMWAALGVGVMIGVAKIDYQWYRKNANLIAIITLVLLALVLASRPINGARRWLGFGSFSFQPSELAKIAVVIYFAAALSVTKEKIRQLNYLVRYGIMLGVVLLLLILEPHMSVCIIISLVALIMLLVAGANPRHFILVLAVLIPVAVALAFGADYRADRLKTFFDPFVDPKGDGWQIIQSLYAIGSGGIFGLGFGNSRQKYMYVSEPQNDFIFAIVCEELGLVGAIVIIVLFGLLIWRGIKIAMNAPDTFSSLLVTGIVSLVGVQTFLNIAVVTKMIPTTGIPLPFFSAGGSSLTILMASMGIVLNVSKYKTQVVELR